MSVDYSLREINQNVKIRGYQPHILTKTAYFSQRLGEYSKYLHENIMNYD